MIDSVIQPSKVTLDSGGSKEKLCAIIFCKILANHDKNLYLDAISFSQHETGNEMLQNVVKIAITRHMAAKMIRRPWI